MDCEKFDEHVIDALYGELDELTAAAMNRHADGCARCAGVLSGLKSAREAAIMPLDEPSAELETRILEAEKAAQRRAPWPRKLMRAAAWAGSHAMRPQLAMAALFMLVVGSSMLLLRARPGTVGAPVQVTERGEPSPAAPPAAQEAPAKGRSARTLESESGKAESDGKAAAADRSNADKDRFAAPVEEPGAPAPAAATAEAQLGGPGAAASAAAPSGGSSGDAQQALAAARESRNKNGCVDAIGRYKDLEKRYPDTKEAEVASREAGECEHGTAMPAAKPPATPKAGGKTDATSAPAPGATDH